MAWLKHPEGTNMADGTPEQPSSISRVPIRIEWVVPDDIRPQYATNFTVQRLEHEYLISMFQLMPPLIVGTPDQITQQVQDANSIQAKCIFQMLVAADRLQDFADLVNGAASLPIAITGSPSNANESSAGS